MVESNNSPFRSLGGVIFVTGIGTAIGKTLVSAILAEALESDYWKPVQAGVDGMTDSDWVKQNITNSKSVIHPELFRLTMAFAPLADAYRKAGRDYEERFKSDVLSKWITAKQQQKLSWNQVSTEGNALLEQLFPDVRAR